MKKLLLILLGALSTLAYAQEANQGPDLYTTDNSFFDPTKPVEKPREVYHFGVEYRLEVGFAQDWQKTDLTYPDLYLHGLRLGGTFTFLLPHHFSMQTGLIYILQYGQSQQHFRSMDAQSTQLEYLTHHIVNNQLTIPVRAFYTIPVWKELNLFLYAGPQLQLGLGQTDIIRQHLSDKTLAWIQQQGIRCEQYDRYIEKELLRTNIQMGVGGGLEWDKYRLQAGYDFGLNNMVRYNNLIGKQTMNDWSWYTTFSYRF